MTLPCHSYTFLMVLPLPLSFRLSWILLFLKITLILLPRQLVKRASTHRAVGCAGGHAGPVTVAGISLVRTPGRMETQRGKVDKEETAEVPISSFALLTTQVEISGYGRIAHRAGTVFIHFPHRVYSCFHIGGKKDRIRIIQLFWLENTFKTIESNH